MDYEKIGLKSGIEIHQQLDTHKLFCECPSLLRKDDPDIIIKRRLYAAAGETGKVDVAAFYEQSKQKEFVYEAYSNSTCLVELDEEPPHQINEEALRIALQISLLLNAKPLNVTQVMRKTVVDGSNTSGFQRTLLIARNGFIDVKGKRIGIQNICLEEDSARIIKKTDKEVTFRLDRLGIPLVEIATSPDIKNPEEAKLVALKIGEILRSCKVKRGIGTIRQDVNMSITNRPRIEIKGVQDPRLIDKTIETEIERQLKLKKQKKKLEQEVRKANLDGTTSFLRPLPGAARMYPETDIPLVKITWKMLQDIKKSLPRPKHEIRQELEEKMHSELAKALLKEGKLEDYKVLIKIYNKPGLITKMLAIWPKEIASHEKLSMEKVNSRLSMDVLETITENLASGKIDQIDVKKILVDIIKGRSVTEAIKIEKVDMKKIENEIKKFIKKKPGLRINAYMGLIMKKYKGKINAAQVVEIIKKYI
ncbi:MAG: Glu-tRNA(Gln) amidotransferase subunit GatE [Candidatus Pacearchaeota archaeon]|nr:MAG: Glu-tRNA(Gln) amidotransferase subunit GatE [Candidatus Pacearchaeota archaeon]